MTSSLFDAITSWDNLLLAYRKAARGKRGKASTARFEHQLADRLLTLQLDLVGRTYRPGRYVHFVIHDPKLRKISASPFRDRVTHHALCNLIEPLFERSFIEDSYANRMGKGTHRAVDRLQQFARRYRYVLRCDVVQFFPSLDLALLGRELRRHLPDEGTLWLCDQIMRSGAGVLADEYDMVYFPGDDLFAAERPRGLPIGNLTSQFWANCYMSPFDHFVKRELRCPAYLRYVDDFALFSDHKAELWAWKRAIIDRLAAWRLTLHEAEAQVAPVDSGIPWLGFVVYPTHRRVKARNLVKFTRRLRERWAEYAAGRLSFAEFDASVQGWINYVRYADTWGLRKHVLGRPFPKRT
jgi:retron-type reverse transcriptase